MKEYIDVLNFLRSNGGKPKLTWIEVIRKNMTAQGLCLAHIMTKYGHLSAFRNLYILQLVQTVDTGKPCPQGVVFH